MNNNNNKNSTHCQIGHSRYPVNQSTCDQKHATNLLDNNNLPFEFTGNRDSFASGHGDPLFDKCKYLDNNIHSTTTSINTKKISIDPVQANNPLHTGLFGFPKNKVNNQSKHAEQIQPSTTTQLHNNNERGLYNERELYKDNQPINKIENTFTSNENIHTTADSESHYHDCSFVGVHGDEHFLRHKNKQEREKLKNEHQIERNTCYGESSSEIDTGNTDSNEVRNHDSSSSNRFVGVHGDEHFLRHKNKEEREKLKNENNNRSTQNEDEEKHIIHVTEEDIHEMSEHLEKGEMREMKAKEHEAKQIEYRNARKIEENIAKSPDASLIEKTKAAGNILIDSVKELKEAGLKKYEEMRAEKEKEKVHHL